MVAASIDGVKLKQALEEFGSLEQAIGHLQKEKLTFKKENDQLQQQKAELQLARDQLFIEVMDAQQELSQQKTKLKSLANKVEQYGRQYELFQGFLAMVVGSPSVTGSIETLIAIFQKLCGEGWQTSKKADDLRSLFVRTILGDYLKCFCCKVCGAKFMVNKEPRYKSISNYYECPSCHTPRGVEPDDSFLKAMVSEEQMDNTRRTAEVQKENDALKPLKVFLNLPCEICGQPMTEWSEQDLRRGVTGGGWGHTKCWNTTGGEVRQFAKLVKEEMERRMQSL